MLVGGVDEHGLAAAAAAQDVHVVVHRAHHDLVDLGGGVAPDFLKLSHGPSVRQLGRLADGRAIHRGVLVARGPGLVDTG